MDIPGAVEYHDFFNECGLQAIESCIYCGVYGHMLSAKNTLTGAGGIGPPAPPLWDVRSVVRIMETRGSL